MSACWSNTSVLSLFAEESKINGQGVPVERHIPEADWKIFRKLHEMLLHLARIQAHKLLTDEEFARFSPETREAVHGLLEIWRA